MKDLKNKLKEQGKHKNIEFVVSNNDKSFQNNTYSCGFYCLHFMEHMLQGLHFH